MAQFIVRNEPSVLQALGELFRDFVMYVRQIKWSRPPFLDFAGS
jgi:hypothetical protein